MKRREFITLLGGAAAAWPLAARAQQAEPIRRMVVLMGAAETPSSRGWLAAVFDFLPQMESFAAFGIKAQWRKRLDEAEKILEQLKQSTKASAQLGYYLLGWGSRIGGRTASKKRDVADQIDKALTSLGVDPDTLATFKRDYLFFARYDLFDRFDAIASLNIRANKLSPKPTTNLLEEPPPQPA